MVEACNVYRDCDGERIYVNGLVLSLSYLFNFL